VPLLGRIGAVVAGLGVSLQPALLQYGSVGRVDHHGLILLTTAALLGFGLRLAINPSRDRIPVAGGVVAALGIWVSTEVLLPVALLLIAFLVAWIVSGVPRASVMRNFAVWWAGASMVVLVVERAPDMLTPRDLDRISAVHLLVAVLAAAFWMLVGMARTARWQARALLALGAGTVTAATLWLLAPSFVAGPFGTCRPPCGMHGCRESPSYNHSGRSVRTRHKRCTC
jgi:hypothetical protein